MFYYVLNFKINIHNAPQFTSEQRNFWAMGYRKYKGTQVFVKLHSDLKILIQIQLVGVGVDFVF